MFEGIDLYSDTMTRPTAQMKKAMVDAPLGDEQKSEDPTTRQLEEKVASLLGKEMALFFPSATMANQVAILTHCGRGDELIAADNAHIFFAEAGGPAVWAGALARPIATPTGVFTGAEIRARFSPAGYGPGHPISRLVAVENTTNMGGGIAWPMQTLESVWEACRDLKLNCHLDGSRFFHASVAVGKSPREVAKGFDTITICLSKGLGCPAGAILAFRAEAYDAIRVWKQRMGGSLRQSGVLAAAGIYALDHHLERISQDHIHAERLAEGLSLLPSISVEKPPSRTNMVFFSLNSASMDDAQWLQACEEKGFRFSLMGPNRFRAVTHLGISASDIERVVAGVREITAKW